ncbi:MAG: hypothetical protein GY838_03800 [bacterium]|nr:hypothetical protein [bacterium]
MDGNTEDSFGITLVSRMKHTDLYRAAKAIGSVKALGRHLGVEYSALIKWCNLHGNPPVTDSEIESRRQYWTRKRVDELEQKLFALTGKLLDDLFPIEFRNNIAFKSMPKVREATKRFDRQALQDLTQDRLTLPSPVDVCGEKERQELIGETVAVMLEGMTERESRVVAMRFGLAGHEPQSLREVAQAMGVTKERVRQIVLRAIERARSQPGTWRAARSV